MTGFVRPSWLSEEALDAFLERTCAESGVPLVVEDPSALARVGVLMRAPSPVPTLPHSESSVAS